MWERLTDLLSSFNSVGLICGVIVIYMVFDWLSGRNSNRKMAKQIRDDTLNVFDADFRWERVGLRSFPGVDLDFYERVTGELRELGYHPLGDIEFLHVSAAMPKLRCGVRIFGTGHGQISGAAYHMRVRGFGALLALLMMGKRNFRVVEFQTALSDGRFVTSTTADKAGVMSSPGEIIKFTYPPGSPVRALQERHIENVKQFCTGESGAPAPLPANTLEQIMMLEEKQHEIERVHRREIGGFSEQELKRLQPGMPAKRRAALVAEMERLKGRAH